MVCLADAAYGQTYRFHAERPSYDRERDMVHRADGTPIDVNPAGSPVVARVSIMGPLEQRAGFYGEGACAMGFSDGYDAIAARMCAALADGDVLVEFDTPGGAVLGLPECCDAIVAAKAMYGRRITSIVNGMCASAGFWLASAITDPGELYITRQSMAGSIGARAAHCDESGALAMDGVAVTDFAYPSGKIALSPNRPLSDVGKARGERDVMAAFEAFAASVEAARPMLTRKAIVALDADMLTGAAAVGEGLADAVASVEEVEAWAMLRATGADMDDPKKDEEAKRAEGGEEPEARRAEEPPEHKEPDGDEKAATCKRCGEMPGKDARYCATCGAKVADDEPPPKKDDEPEARVPAGASVATMLGLRPGASDVAIKSALAPILGFVAFAKDALAVKTLDAAKGALRGTIEDAAAGVKAAKDLRIERERNDVRERWDLVGKLNKASAYPRADLYVDEITETPDGKGGVNVTRKAVALAPQYAEMKIDTLRGLVKTKTASAPPTKTPWQPDAKAAEQARATGGMTLADAMKEPAVIAASQRPGALPIEKLAAAHLVTMTQKMQNGASAPQNGAR